MKSFTRESILKDLQATGSSRVHGLGTFKIIDKPERKGRNPRTGESITIPARREVKFKAASGLAAEVNGAAAAE